MNVLFVMAFPGYLRYFDSVVRLLAERGHSVRLAFNLPFKEIDGMESLADAPGDIRWFEQAPLHDTVWQSVALAVRGAVDYARYLHPMYADSPFLRHRMRGVLSFPFRFLRRYERLEASRADRLVGALLALEPAIPSSRRIQCFIRAVNPDVVVLTPLVTDRSPQVDWVKAARAAGKPSALCVASWDHLTSKGLMRVHPDLVTVWNETQRDEAVRYHGVPPDRIALTGAIPFDRWFDRAPQRSRAEFCQRVGLADDRPILLFLGSSASISPPNEEVAFVRQWLDTVRASSDPTLRECGVLIRPHPYNSAHWDKVEWHDAGRVAVFPRHGSSPARESDRADFFDSLYHAAVVVGLNTSAMIEAAIVGRRVLTVLAPEFTSTQQGTLHFHYLLPEHGGFVRVASSLEEHLGQLAEALREGPAGRADLERFVATFVRPLGRDVAATARLADALEQAARTSPHPAAGTPLWAYGARAIMWTLGVASALPDPLLRRRAWRELKSRARPVKRRLLHELDFATAKETYRAARQRRKRRDR